MLKSQNVLSVSDRQKSLAWHAYARQLIDETLYNALCDARTSYEVCEMLHDLIETRNLDFVNFIGVAVYTAR